MYVPVIKASNMTASRHSNKLISHKPTQLELWSYRGVILGTVALIIIYYQNIQRLVNHLYDYCLSTWIFNSVYFETYWQAVCFFPISFIPYAIDKISFFDKYKIDPKVKWQSPGMVQNIIEGFVYLLPLGFLDTIMVKKYSGVDPSEWTSRRVNWIQYTRALPENPPTVYEIVYQLTVAFILYDFVFFIFHFAMHKNRFLYKYVHAMHHDHKELHTRVTNQLTVAERILLILSANESLKITGSHPLTRAFFVPIFQAWLVDNHTGYSFPWGIDKIVPFNLVAGPVKHYAHHVYGDRNYAPFFTYADRVFIESNKSKKEKAAD